MQNELKPCPFCGYDHPNIKHQYYSDTYYVHCVNCQSNFSLDCTSGRYKSEEKTKEAWNKRAEKNTPKKVLPDSKYYGNGICPNCNAVFVDKSTNFCGNCGQALDWSD